MGVCLLLVSLGGGAGHSHATGVILVGSIITHVRTRQGPSELIGVHGFADSERLHLSSTVSTIQELTTISKFVEFDNFEFL
jgi:hypothetical protein